MTINRRELGSFFLRLGALGFGGPPANVAQMQDYFVGRGIIPLERFATLYSIIKVFPGPVAVQMSLALGLEVAGVAGALIAFAAYILPSLIMILVLASAYGHFRAQSQFQLWTLSLQACALGLIISSTVRMGQRFVGDLRAWVIGIITATIVFWRPSVEPALILVFGGAGLALRFLGGSRRPQCWILIAIGTSALLIGTPAWAEIASTGYSVLVELFWVCFKAGEFVFGTGLAVVPLLEGDFVNRLHWLTHADFLNAVAMGQITPGPVTITAAFIGFQVAHLPGALAAISGMYLPSMINIFFIFPRVARLVSRPGVAQTFIDWAFPSVIGAIFGACARLSPPIFQGGYDSIAIALVSLGGSLVLKVEPWLLMLLAAGYAGVRIYLG